MTSIEIARSFDELEALLRRPDAPAEPVLLTKDGVAYAALVPLNGVEADDETRATLRSRRFRQALARSRADSAAGREQPLEEVVRELGLSSR